MKRATLLLRIASSWTGLGSALAGCKAWSSTSACCLLALVSLMAVGNCQSSPRFVPFGVNFSPYEKNQNPLPGTLVINTAQVASRLKTIRGTALWIRTYSVTHGLETAGALAHQAGFKTALGAWLGPESDSAGAGLASNQQEIASLIAAANRGEADMLLVGSEVLQRGDLTAARLLEYMQQVRAAVPGIIPVTTNDTYTALLSNTNVIAGSDIVLANFYPYWEGTRIDAAIASLDSEYRELAQVAGAKELWIGETGWPSAGNTIGLAVPGPQNAAYYFLAFNSWARTNNVKSFYFEAFDEAWKAAAEGPQGAHWGIRTSSGGLKDGMNQVYNGGTLPAQIVMRQMPSTGLPGTPGVQLTSIPAYGSSHGIAGVVTGIQSAEYEVAVYINVSGGWWTKPTFEDPTVPINPDGTFTCNTVTGGNDANATEFALFVVPAGYAPPAAAGSSSVPSAVASHAVASADVSRPVGYAGSTTTPPVADIRSFTINRVFAGGCYSADSVSVKGELPIANTAVPGANVMVSIGSAYWQFAPAAKNGVAVVNGGNCQNPSGRLTISAGKNGWTFSAKMECASGNTNWDDDGLLNTTIPAPGIPVFMPVIITVGSQNYVQITSGYYTAKDGKNGVLK